MAMTGAPRVFFDIVGTFNAHRLIADTKAQQTVVEAIVLDSVSQMMDSIAGIGEALTQVTSLVLPLALALSESTIEFEKFAGINNELKESIIDTGMAFGFTANESLAAGAKMAQLTAIIGESAVATATQLGQTFALISGMGTAEAMTRIINLQQQTKFMYAGMTETQFAHLDATAQQNTVYANTIEVLDQLNTVENNSASTMKQLTFVMNQFAAQAHQTGESIAYMAAMSAVLIEAGEEQGKAGRALRMIYARLGSNMMDNNDLLHKYGIATHDVTTGALRPLSAVVEDLGGIWNTLGEAQKQNIVQTVAGNDHYVRFVKLIQNNVRMSELATMAIEDQSTATVELNRVVEDASTVYKAAQADLEHYQAILGQKLLPSMTAAVQVQTKFTKGLASFGDSKVFKHMSTFILEMQQWMKLMGGVMGMYMQMKSVNIAMETHRTVLRAINGEEIIRTDHYRKQGLFSGITLNTAREYAQVANAAILQELLITDIKEHHMHLEQAIAMKYEQQQVVKLKLAAHDTELLSMTQLQVTKKNELLYTEQNLEILAFKKLQAAQMQAALSERLTGSQRLLLITAQEVNRVDLESGVIATRKMEIKMAAHEAERVAIGEITSRKLWENELEQMISNYRNREGQKTLKQLRAEHKLIESIGKAKLGVHAVSATVDEVEVAAQEEKNLKMSKELTLGQKILEQDTQAILILEGERAAKERVASMDIEKINNMLALGILREEMHLLSVQEMDDLAKLFLAEMNLQEAKDSAQMQRLNENIAVRKSLFGIKDTDKEIARLTGTLGKMSMAAGMASMAVSVLGRMFGLDDERSARIQIILMTMAMIPATLQMAAMSQQMMVQAGASGVATKSIWAQVTSIRALTVAAYNGAAAGWALTKSFLPLLALTLAVGALAWAFEKMTSNANDTKEGLDDMNATLRITTDLLGEMTHAAATAFAVPKDMISIFGENIDLTTMSMADMNAQIAKSDDLLLSYAANQSVYAKEDPMFKHWQNKTNDLLTYTEALKQNKIVMSGQALNEVTPLGGDYFKLLFQQINNGDYGELDFSPDAGLMKETLHKAKATGDYGLVVGEDYMADPYFWHSEETVADVAKGIADGRFGIRDLTDDALDFFIKVGQAGTDAAEDFEYMQPALDASGNAIGDGFSAAEEKMRSFANAREELFFGGKSQYMTGEMMKQVVNKGVENLYSNVELLMTNNFFGLTFDEAVVQISASVTRQLIEQGVPIPQ